MIYAILDGSKNAYQDGAVWSNSAICAVVAILLVFVVLLIIIGVTSLIFKLLGYYDLKKEIDAAKKPAKVTENTAKPLSFDENDEDMVAAVLVATIDYQNEIKQDVKLLNVREIK